MSKDNEKNSATVKDINVPSKTMDHICQEGKKVVSKMENTTLTEKWNGEIKDYWYYYTESGIEQAHYCEVNGIKELVMPDIEEVLAPVLSYEEWYKLNQLLGKCYRFLRLTETKVEAIEKVKRGLVKEIDEVLK